MILQQSLPGSWVATAKIKHADVNLDGEAAGLALINSLNPNHFVKTGDPVQGRHRPGHGGRPARQVGGAGRHVQRQRRSRFRRRRCRGRTPGRSNLRGLRLGAVRLRRDANEVTTWTSTNGTTFASFGAPISVTQYLGQPGGFRVGLFAKHDGSGNDVVDIDAFNVVVGPATRRRRATTAAATGGGCPQVDEFDGTALDPKWEIVNPTPANVAVGGGNLTLTSAVGDVSRRELHRSQHPAAGCPAGSVDGDGEARSTAVAANGQAAGLVIYGSNGPNYFAKTAIQYKTNDLSGQPINGIWAERVLTANSTINSAYGGQYPEHRQADAAG